MDLWTLVQFAGGIGLFLLGMKTMTEGLRSAAGETLRTLLAAATRSRWHGLASGVTITAAVQSSSAVIFATIGFVNAGLISLAQSVGIIYGASIGTSLTSWIVAAVGFDVNLRAMALPFIAIGMALRLAAGRARLGALGEAIAGLGLFFLGLDILKSTFEGLGEGIELAALAGTGLVSLLAFVGIGFLLTTLMQSSSAAMAVIITATVGGVIPLHAAATFVLGAILGTCTTALFAALAATAAGRRAALSHVALNTLTVGVGFVVMPLLLPGVTWFGGLTGGTGNVGVALALFHTAVVVLGVAVMWPLTGWTARRLERLFTTHAADPVRLRHLDSNILATPVMAVDALRLEMGRLNAEGREILASALDRPSADPQQLAERGRGFQRMVQAVGELVGELGSRGGTTAEMEDTIARALRAGQYLVDVTERAVEIRRLADEAAINDAELATRARDFEASVRTFVDRADPLAEGFVKAAVEGERSDLEAAYQALKADLLRGAVRGRIAPERLSVVLDRFSAMRRAVDQLAKIARIEDVLATPQAAVTAESVAPEAGAGLSARG